jgi:Cu/Ag efflux protein CusF
VNFIAVAFVGIFTIGFLTQGTAQTYHKSRAEPVSKHASDNAKTPLIEGVVKKINRYSGRVTVFHDPLPGGIPGMMEAYSVKDEGWLEQLKVGQKIRFTTNAAAGGSTMSRFEIVECTILVCD